MLFDLVALVIFVSIILMLTYLLGIGKKPADPRSESPDMWEKILVDCLLIGVEMCRADGQISEAELEALRNIAVVSKNVISETNAEEAVSAAMRATIHRDAMRAAARRVRKRAPREVRLRLLEYLRDVSNADGVPSEDEQRFLSWVCDVWGCDQPEVLRRLGL